MDLERLQFKDGKWYVDPKDSWNIYGADQRNGRLYISLRDAKNRTCGYTLITENVIWYVGLDASETEDGVPDSVTVGNKVYEGHAGIERLASIPPEMLNSVEQICSALEVL